MTFGERLAYYRTLRGFSQEGLAARLGISRQSVSKWEKGLSSPQIEKIQDICAALSISADLLLTEDPLIDCNRSEYKGKYFGTDGFRGEAGVDLTSQQAYKVGRFLGWYYSSSLSGNTDENYRPRIIVGKDTRRSSYMLEYSIVAGITASGADAYMLHVTTTPSVSYVTRLDEFDCGIMITASHNPYYDNGIKIVNKYGEKLDDSTVSLIEKYLDGDLSHFYLTGKDLPLATRDRIGLIVDYVAGRNRYLGYLISLASHSYRNLRIGLDCANGASWMMAKAVFDALGAQTYTIGNHPNGTNINEDCGSTKVDALQQLVKDNHLNVGFAFDGDADRCIAIDENGCVVDGDKILYILAKRLKSRGILQKDTVVATVMSNIGLFKALEVLGINTEVTAVGDRYVYQAMQENGYQLGGEQSGHIIIRKYATTGDALLTAILLTEDMKDNKTTLSKLAEPVKALPQVTVAFKVRDKELAYNDSEVQMTVKSISDRLGKDGRIVYRASGTESVIRVMVEASSEKVCQNEIDAVKDTLRTRGYLL